MLLAAAWGAPAAHAATPVRVAATPADLKPFLLAGLVRESNKVRAILRAARRELGTVMESPADV